MSFEVWAFPSATAFATTVTVTVPAVWGGRTCTLYTEFAPSKATILLPALTEMPDCVKSTFSPHRSNTVKSFLSASSFAPMKEVRTLPIGTLRISTLAGIKTPVRSRETLQGLPSLHALVGGGKRPSKNTPIPDS